MAITCQYCTVIISLVIYAFRRPTNGLITKPASILRLHHLRSITKVMSVALSAYLRVLVMGPQMQIFPVPVVDDSTFVNTWIAFDLFVVG